MNRQALLLYGVDEQTLPVDAECTHRDIVRARDALNSRGWTVETCHVSHDVQAALAPYSPREWVVFNLCEGSPSQPFYYARVAQILEERGFAFTGSGSRALHDTQFKSSTKRLLEAAGIPTARWQLIHRADDLRFTHFPAIIKPDAEHCSFGITQDSVVLDLGEAKRQAAAALQQHQEGVLVEEFLDSPEYGVALWEREDQLEILGISEIRYEGLARVQDRLCTFEAKWLPETEIYRQTMPVCPAPIEAALRSRLEEVTRRAYRACGLRDYGRVDLRLRDGNPMVLDVNSNCALSQNAGFPDTARIAGWDYPAVLERIAQMALDRGPRDRLPSGRQPIRA